MAAGPAVAGRAAGDGVQEPRVVLPAPDPAAIASSRVDVLCSVCGGAVCRYCCPRCLLQSCSLPCYRLHSASCLQSFHRQQAESSGRGLKVDDAVQSNTRRIIRKLQSEPQHWQPEQRPQQEEEEQAAEEEDDESGGDEDGEDEQEGESSLTMGTAGTTVAESASLSSLSPADRLRFLRSVRSGRLSSAVSLSVPWWTPQRARSCRQAGSGQEAVEVEGNWEPAEEERRVGLTDVDDADSACSLFFRQLPAMSTVSLSPPPSPSLPFHVLSCLFAFCYSYRLYNCEPEAELSGFLTSLLSLSAVLSPAVEEARNAYAMLTSAVSTAQLCLCTARSQPFLYQSPDFSLRCLRDTAHLAINSGLCRRALWSIRQSISAWDDEQQQQEEETGNDTSRRRTKRGKVRPPGLSGVKRKVWYLCVWMAEESSAGRMRQAGQELLQSVYDIERERQ
jgi:hypothetical protein